MTKLQKVLGIGFLLMAFVAVISLGGIAEAKTVIKYAHCGPNSIKSQMHVFGLKFAELAAEYSNNEIEIREFPAAQLGSEQTLFQKARIEDGFIAGGAINNLAVFAQSAGVLTLPYLFASSDEVLKLINGPFFMDIVNEKVVKEAGVRILGCLITGFRVLTNSKKPICSLEDLKGMKIRVPKNPLMVAAFQSWGINPHPLAWSELFTALQQKVVDGQENPYITNNSNKFYEVQKYVTEISYFHWIGPLVISEKYYQKMAPDQRKALNKAVMEAAKYEQQWAIDYTAKAKAALIKEGMVVCKPDDEEQWKEKARSTWPSFYDKVGGKDLVDLALEYLKK